MSTWGIFAAGPSSAVAAASGGIAPGRESVAMAIEADALQELRAGVGGVTAALARWTLHDLTPREGYAGALVVERAARAVVTRGWSIAEAAE